MRDIPGKLLGIFLAVALMIIMPFVTVTVESSMIDRREIIMAVTDFIDEVVDSRNITDTMLAKLNTDISSHGILVDYEIEHYCRSVDPDPLNPGDYYTTFVKDVKDIHEFQKGDKISVHIFSTGYSAAETISHKLAGLFIPKLDETLTARIR